MIGPNVGFVLAVFGTLGIYCELIWPGRIYPGILGGSALVTGGYFLARHSPTHVGIALTAVAVLLFAAEALWNTRFLAGSLGTVSLAVGFCKMFAQPPSIVRGLAIPVCILFGAATTGLCYAARLARRSKGSDILPH